MYPACLPHSVSDILPSQVRRRRWGRSRRRGWNIRWPLSILTFPILPLPPALFPIFPPLVLPSRFIIISGLTLIGTIVRVISAVGRGAGVNITSAEYH
jgi:hypothetical protein